MLQYPIYKITPVICLRTQKPHLFNNTENTHQQQQSIFLWQTKNKKKKKKLLRLF